MRSGDLREAFHTAFLDAFRRAGEMDIVVDRADLGVSFANFLVGHGVTYEYALFSLIDWVDAQDKLVPLLNSATRRCPGNPKLRQLAATLADLESRFIDLRPTSTFEEAERIVLKGVKFEDVGPWIDQLAVMRRAVCRIEPQPERLSIEGYGTGFLVAPDVVMTAFHVAEPFWSNQEAAADVVLRFDYEAVGSGKPRTGGTEHKLARTPQNCSSLPGVSGECPWQVAYSRELDFALLKLSRSAGEDPVPGGSRGFLRLTRRRFSPTDPVLILQHPAAEPMKLSFGAVEKPVPPSHVVYKVNTEPGSSGSPCLTQDLKVTAIHHFGLTDSNRGVTQEAILKYLESVGKANLFSQSSLNLKDNVESNYNPTLDGLQDSESNHKAHLDKITKFIHTSLDEIVKCNIVDKYCGPISAAQFLASELTCGEAQSPMSLSQHIAAFLTSRCNYEDIMSVMKTYEALRGNNKNAESLIVCDIVFNLLPLCLPPDAHDEARRSVRPNNCVLISTSLKMKMGAELLVARLYEKPARFAKSSLLPPEPQDEQSVPFEPHGEKLVDYQPAPIDDPDSGVDLQLKALHLSLFSKEVKEDERMAKAKQMVTSLDTIREHLASHLQAMKDQDHGVKRSRMPCYCIYKLAGNKDDRLEQSRQLEALRIPHLLFIGLDFIKGENVASGFEGYIIPCLRMQRNSQALGRD